ncbi:O-antigen ligase family protein [Testudinibacter sp. P80/BLE/0925]|uniref:O-antigen ligase family protein n=1 Tax=Testudinibacter sp. TW-1 TaxID=3417757 RepID=UPI003D35AB52
MTAFNPFFSRAINLLVGLHFLVLLTLPKGYNYVPSLLILCGFVFLIRQIRNARYAITLDRDQKQLFLSYSVYFLLFVLSFWLHDGRLRELDNPSRIIFFLPILLLLIQTKFDFKLLAYFLPIGALLGGLTALYQRLYLGQDMAFGHIMHIQGGDISMSLGLFSLCSAMYWYHAKNKTMAIFSVIFALFGIVGSILSTARGGWIGAPFLILWIFFLYRHTLSKRFWLSAVLISVLLISMLFVFSEQTRLIERLVSAQTEISNYFQHNNGSTSVGARFDMWKSAVLAITEKPLFGWGIDAISTLRQQQAEQGIISQYAGSFNHAHNQYLDDASKRGLLGLTALLAIFFVPLVFFSKTLRQAQQNAALRYVALLGIVHVLAVMSYGVSQGFFAHNSGNTFYFFSVIVFYAAVYSVKNAEADKSL